MFAGLAVEGILGFRQCAFIHTFTVVLNADPDLCGVRRNVNLNTCRIRLNRILRQIGDDVTDGCVHGSGVPEFGDDPLQ